MYISFPRGFLAFNTRNFSLVNAMQCDDDDGEVDPLKLFEEAATPWRSRLIKKRIWGGSEKEMDAHQAEVRMSHCHSLFLRC
jgi:hypothetical protein